MIDGRSLVLPPVRLVRQVGFCPAFWAAYSAASSYLAILYRWRLWNHSTATSSEGSQSTTTRKTTFNHPPTHLPSTIMASIIRRSAFRAPRTILNARGAATTPLPTANAAEKAQSSGVLRKEARKNPELYVHSPNATQSHC
jgi:hypothetical protein